MWGSLQVVHCEHASILHGYGDMEACKDFGVMTLDPLRLRDVISHVVIPSQTPQPNFFLISAG